MEDLSSVIVLPSLPSDIITDILSRLPAKPLCRFKCVSKPWYKLLNSRNFIKLHLTQTLKSTHHRHLLISSHPISTAPITTDHRNHLNFSRLNHSLTHLSPYGVYNIHGACHGIVCIGDGTNTEIALYNPFTRTHRLLPPPSEIRRPHSRKYETIRIGFGYDTLRDDYKVLRIYQFQENGFDDRSDVSLYSYKNDTWENVVAPMPTYYLCCNLTVLIGDVLHFCGYRYDGDERIVCFNLRTNIFSMFNYPKTVAECRPFIRMIQLDDSLCVFDNFYNPSGVELWIMKEHGNEESWVKQYRIRYCDGYVGRPVAYWGVERGKSVLLMNLVCCGLKFASYDCDTEEYERVEGDGLPVAGDENFYDVWTLVENLVLLTEGSAKLNDGNVPNKKRKRIYQIDSDASPSGSQLGSK